MQNFKLDKKIEQEFSNFLQKFDTVLKDKIQNKVKKDITLYDVSETLYELRESLTHIAMRNIILLMLLARTCLKRYGFSLQQVILDNEVRVAFYDKSRLQIVLKLYSEMFLKVPLENQYKQSPEIKISNNFNKEAIHRAKKKGPGLVTILGLQPYELNNEKKILNKKLKNMIRANHPDRINNSEIDEKEKKERDEKYKAADQMKDFLENGVLTLYLNEKIKQKNKEKNTENLDQKNTRFQKEKGNHEVLAIENSNSNPLKMNSGKNKIMKEKTVEMQSENILIAANVKEEVIAINPQKNDETIKKGNKDSFTYYIDQGGKQTQEDTVVFSEISSKIVENLSPKQIGDRLFTAHRNLDEDKTVKENRNEGTTASTTVYDGKGSLITATLGDAVSFAAVYDKDNNLLGVMRLNSVVHSPSEISEQDRIKNAGGTVSNGRVNGMLAVSRAIGDHWGKKIEGNNNLIVSSESAIDIHSVEDILKHISTEENKINQDNVGKIQIISASDGLTDGMYSIKQENNEKNLKNWIIGIENYQKRDELEFAESLVNKAKEEDSKYGMGKRDNTSVAIHTISFENKESKEKPVLMGVYDGHGGSVISSHVANNISNKFKEQCSLTQENYLNQHFTQETYLKNTCDDIVEKLRTLTKSCMREVGGLRDANKVLKSLNGILNEEITSAVKIEEFYKHLGKNTNNKKNINIIKDDQSRATGRFIAGVIAIAAIILTLPLGLAVMGAVYAFAKKNDFKAKLPHHLLRPHKKGNELGDALEKRKESHLQTVGFFNKAKNEIKENTDENQRKYR